MTHLNDTMPTNLLATHRKYAHLTKEERVMIATLKSQGLSNRAIGRQLGVNHQTINNELKRGTVRQIRRQKFNGKTYCILQVKSAEKCNDFLHSLAAHFLFYLVI